jgi:hypothetical protein
LEKEQAGAQRASPTSTSNGHVTSRCISPVPKGHAGVYPIPFHPAFVLAGPASSTQDCPLPNARILQIASLGLKGKPVFDYNGLESFLV